MKSLFAAVLVISVLSMDRENKRPDFKNAIWQADVGGVHFEGDEVLLTEGFGLGYTIKAIKRHNKQDYRPLIIFSRLYKPVVGSYALDSAFTTNYAMTTVAELCPDISGHCEALEVSQSGQLNIIKFDSDSLVARFAFETENRTVANGVIKHKLVKK